MKTILLIEDHDLMRMFLVNFIGKDHQVYSVKSPQEAVDWLRIANVDLILSDYPSSSHFENQMRALQASADEKAIPMMILTDEDKSEQRIQAFNWGAKDSLSKPFNPVELKIRIKNQILMNIAIKEKTKGVLPF